MTWKVGQWIMFPPIVGTKLKRGQITAIKERLTDGVTIYRIKPHSYHHSPIWLEGRKLEEVK